MAETPRRLAVMNSELPESVSEDRRPTEFLLVRHAEKLHGPSDLGLSTTGREQAAVLAAQLRRLQPDSLYTSPLARAVETAREIGEACSLRVHVDRRLVERRIHGQDESAFRIEWNRSEGDRAYVSPGGESSLAAGHRLERALLAISDCDSGNRIIVVTHGGVVRDLLRNLSRSESNCERGNAFAPAIPLASITRLAKVDAGWEILSIGELAQEMGDR